MRVALAQLSPTPGDVRGNAAALAAAHARAAADGAEVLVAPELCVLGYPPRDLLLRSAVTQQCVVAVNELALLTGEGPAIVLGAPWPSEAETGPPLWNAALFLAEGRVAAVYAKRLLPTYDVFDERRYFAPGEHPGIVEYGGKRIGLLVCEDMWSRDEVMGRSLYTVDPVRELREAGVDFAVGISASPYHGGKDAHRLALFQGEAKRLGRPLVSVSQVGGNDDVLFDGRSRLIAGDGREVARLAAFEPDYAVFDLDALPDEIDPPRIDEAEELRQALVMGIRDYYRKTGLSGALIGLSGGVDSSVVAGLAVDALGADQVTGVSMPGPFTAAASREDARAITDAVGAGFHEISIQRAYEEMREALAPVFGDLPFDTTEENLQARLRGTTLMALSNKFGPIVLSTGNKSEVAVGYCTLYGDMNGGLAVLSDVWKLQVYALAEIYIDRGWIPRRVVERPPSAELRPDQTDQDSLPPYEELDRILRRRIEEGYSLAQLVAAGEDEATATRVLRMLEIAEYKRRQMAPGLKVSPVAFGVGWRMPIARKIDLASL